MLRRKSPNGTFSTVSNPETSDFGIFAVFCSSFRVKRAGFAAFCSKFALNSEQALGVFREDILTLSVGVERVQKQFAEIYRR